MTRIGLAFVVAASFAGIASANTFKDADRRAYSELSRKALLLEKDVNDAATMVAQTKDLGQFVCLNEIVHALDRISNRLLTTSVLVAISVHMREPADEAVVNETLAIDASTGLGLSAGDRQRALTMAASCSGSALVNTYAQKAAALADDAIVLLRTTNNKVAAFRPTLPQ